MNPWVIASGTIIAAIITALGVITAARIAKQSIEAYRKQKQADSENYSRQKEIDRREEVVKRQRAEYERYFELFWTLQRLTPGSPEHGQIHAAYNLARDNISFYASDEGLRRIYEFHKYIVDHPNNGDKDLDRVKTLYAAMTIALRRDCIGATDITVEELKPLLTISI